MDPLFAFLLRMGDSTLILGHRVSEWCGHGPALEEDIALANTALDLIGHTQMWLGLAAEVEGQGRSADDLAFLREASGFRNHLLVECPNGDFGVTILRQFLFDVWHQETLTALEAATDGRVAEIAAKAGREVAYHVERSSDLVIRLGDGSDESHRRMAAALDVLWPFTGEMFVDDAVDTAMSAAGIAPLPSTLAPRWQSRVGDVLARATLKMPAALGPQKGARNGIHTEHLSRLLAEMQVLQRSHPGAVW